MKFKNKTHTKNTNAKQNEKRIVKKYKIIHQTRLNTPHTVFVVLRSFLYNWRLPIDSAKIIIIICNENQLSVIEQPLLKLKTICVFAVFSPSLNFAIFLLLSLSLSLFFHFRLFHFNWSWSTLEFAFLNHIDPMGELLLLTKSDAWVIIIVFGVTLPFFCPFHQNISTFSLSDCICRILFRLETVYLALYTIF